MDFKQIGGIVMGIIIIFYSCDTVIGVVHAAFFHSSISPLYNSHAGLLMMSIVK